MDSEDRDLQQEGEPGEEPTQPPRSGGSGVRETIERTLLLGVGAATISMERIEAIVDDFVRRGQLSREEGREMVEDLTDRSRDEVRSMRDRVDGSLQKTYGELGLATSSQLEDLDFRLRQLEHRIGLVEKQLDEESKGSEEV